MLQSRIMTISFYRRNLPHWQPENCSIFLTWRLYGSLPKGFAERLHKWSGEPGKQFLNADRMLDAASNGPLWLNDPEIAAMRNAPSSAARSLGTLCCEPGRSCPIMCTSCLTRSCRSRSLRSGLRERQPRTPMPRSAARRCRSGRTNRLITGFAAPGSLLKSKHTSKTIR
jgi:hypothetical protein